MLHYVKNVICCSKFSWRELFMTVEPIRDKKNPTNVYLPKRKHPKYGLLFKFGLNTGLRISDILPRKVSDIFNNNWCFKITCIKEKKTGKEKKIKQQCFTHLYKVVRKNQNLSLDSYLFHSQKVVI